MHFTPESIIEGGTLGQLLHFTNNCKDKTIEQYTITYGITAPQLKVLICIGLRGITSPVLLGQELRIDTGAISRLLSRLEDKGFIKRNRNKQDRRQVDLLLTKQGITITKKIPEIVANALNQLTSSLTSDEIVLLETLLTKILLANGYAPSAYSLINVR